MIKLRNLTQRYAIAFAAIMTVATVLITRTVSFFVRLMPDSGTRAFIYEIAHIIWPVALIFLLGYGFTLKEKGFGKTLKASLGFAAIFLVSAVLSLARDLKNPDMAWQTWDKIVLGIVMLIGVGLREELIFRGVIQNALAIKYAKSSKGIWLTVAVSALAFGLLHYGNVFSGVTFGAASLQVLGAMATGAVFGAFYLRGGNIWVPILIHAVVDFQSLLETTFTTNAGTEIEKLNNTNATGLIILIPALILLAVFLLRKSKHAEILARMEALRVKYGEEA